MADKINPIAAMSADNVLASAPDNTLLSVPLRLPLPDWGGALKNQADLIARQQAQLKDQQGQIQSQETQLQNQAGQIADQAKALENQARRANDLDARLNNVAASVNSHNNHNAFWSARNNNWLIGAVDKATGATLAVFRFDGTNWNLDNKNSAYTDITRGTEHISMAPNASHSIIGGGWFITFPPCSMFCHYASADGIFVATNSNAVDFARW